MKTAIGTSRPLKRWCARYRNVQCGCKCGLKERKGQGNFSEVTTGSNATRVLYLRRVTENMFSRGARGTAKGNISGICFTPISSGTPESITNRQILSGSER